MCLWLERKIIEQRDDVKLLLQEEEGGGVIVGRNGWESLSVWCCVGNHRIWFANIIFGVAGLGTIQSCAPLPHFPNVPHRPTAKIFVEVCSRHSAMAQFKSGPFLYAARMVGRYESVCCNAMIVYTRSDCISLCYDLGCPFESFLFFSLFINLVTIFLSCPAGLSLLVCCSASRFDLCLPEPPLYMALSWSKL